ncbi:hypothetical protein BC938DRAFT_481927 [Jimgerdemannia flammicorona]|uniref:Uncharacterized protein n=1 Tax=Jimgerdemannia flammicorona TaxID=994334 RepID=A0A433QF28_9FUNG|nr:hypothetical protein BC938DRAFT_481927 [Jimgerdemannia flammicorona]
MITWQLQDSYHTASYGIYGPDTVPSVPPHTAELIYESQDKCDKAQLLLERAPALREKVSGSVHQDMETCLKIWLRSTNLQGKYDQAEPSARRQTLWEDVSYQQGRGITLQASQCCFGASLWLPAIAEDKGRGCKGVIELGMLTSGFRG